MSTSLIVWLINKCVKWQSTAAKMMNRGNQKRNILELMNQEITIEFSQNGNDSNYDDDGASQMHNSCLKKIKISTLFIASSPLSLS